MESPLFVVQQILSGLAISNVGPRDLNAVNLTAPTNGTEAPDAPSSGETKLSSVITLLFSISALSDWFKLIVIGWFFETCRRVAFGVYYQFIDSFFITARFQEDDISYDWMMLWLSNQPFWTTARDLSISTHSTDVRSIRIPGEDDLVPQNSRKLAYRPSVSVSRSMWYKHRWMTVTREETQTGGVYSRREETLQITIMTRSHGFLNELLLEAKKQYMASQENTISIYVAATNGNYWRLHATRPKRSMQSIVLDPGIKYTLINDARDFLDSKDWYSARGIPHRRGYLLYGAPGSGKTSMIHSIAGELGLDVYVVSLSRAGLDDSSLNELISELPERSIMLMEDIDAAFQTGLARRDLPHEDETEHRNDNDEKSKPTEVTSSSRVTLGGLLNCLDGCGAQEGRILYATTNNRSALDPALVRAGRMDVHVEFRLASKFQARELYRCFYAPDGADEATGADVCDSGYSSASYKEFDLGTSPTSSSASLTSSEVPETTASTVFTGASHHGRIPPLSKHQVNSLASAFSDAIPEREVSMASLQGYLMMYKTRPFHAVHEAAAWVATEEASQRTGMGKGNGKGKHEVQGLEASRDSPSPSVDESEKGLNDEIKIPLSVAAALPNGSPAVVSFYAPVHPSPSNLKETDAS